ncbi:hypothetical protein COBT_003281 [Conglomerata obtusa]
MEIEIKKRVEEIVNREMKQFRNTCFIKKNVKNNFRCAFTKGKNFNDGKIENSIECFKCGQAGHLARGCLKGFVNSNFNKKSDDSYLYFYNRDENIFINKIFNNDLINSNKRQKVELNKLISDYPTVLGEMQEEKVIF